MEKRRKIRSAVAWCVSLAMLENTTMGLFPVIDKVKASNTVTITPGNDEARTGSGQMKISLKIKKTPVAEDFIFTPPTSLTYDEKPKKATIEVKDDVKGMGNITVEYYEGDTKLDSAPVSEGTYTVKVTTTEGDEYTAVDALTSEDWTFTISAPAPSMAIRLVIHGHEFSYTANGAVITAKCEGEIGDCDLTEVPTLTLKAPPKKTDIDNESAQALLDGLEEFNNATGMNITADSIEYYSGTEKLSSAPGEGGNYTAKLTVGDAVASVDYSIKKLKQTSSMSITLLIKEIPDLKVSLENWIYGEEAETPVITGNDGEGAVTFEYKVKDADDSTYTSTVPEDAGEYVVKAKVQETETHRSAEATDEFVIEKADITPEILISDWVYGTRSNTPYVTGNAGHGDVTYTYYSGEEKLTGIPASAGTYTVKADIAETDNYNSAKAAADFKIEKADFNVKSAGFEDLYDGESHGISVSTSVNTAKIYFSDKKLSSEEEFRNSGLSESPEFKNNSA